MRYFFALPFLLSAGLMLATGQAVAQAPAQAGDSVVVGVERVVVSGRQANPMLTAADSARERARLENVRTLRKSGRPAAKPLGTLSGGAAPIVPPAPAPPPAAQPEAAPDPKQQAALDKRREKAAREAEEAEKQRQKVLYKRAKKSL